MQPDSFTASAAAVGAPYGMTATDVLAYLALGDRRHPDAPGEECGAVDPRNESRRCRRPAHPSAEDHCCYRLDEDWSSDGTT